MNKYKTFEELKEELGDKFEEYMYKSNIELLERIDNTIEYIKNCTMGGDNVYVDNIEVEALLEILGDKENGK